MLAQKYCTAGFHPGVIYFHVRFPRAAVVSAQQRLIDGSALEMKTSFGGHSSRLDPWATVSKPRDYFDSLESRTTPQELERDGDVGTWIRFAVGHLDSVSEVEGALLRLLEDCLPGVGTPHPTPKVSVSLCASAAEV